MKIFFACVLGMVLLGSSKVGLPENTFFNESKMFRFYDKDTNVVCYVLSNNMHCVKL